MRIASDQPNTLKLHDNISDSSIHLYYRTPTVKEVAGYTNGMTKRIRNKIVNCTGECRQKHGKAILEGFRDGDFGMLKNGEPVMISSNPDSAAYDPEWKNLFCKYAAALVERLAIHAFEQTADTDDGTELPDNRSRRREDSDPS